MEMEWSARPRDFAREAVALIGSACATHPLRRPDVPLSPDDHLSTPLPPSHAPSDPLTAASADPLISPGSDPLSSTNTFSTLGSVQLQGVEAVATHGTATSRFVNWKDRRALILKQYAVTGHLRVSSELLNVDSVASAALGSNLDDGAAASGKKVESVLDTKTRRRLEQLAAAEEGSTVRLTQQELITRVETLEVDLRRAWEAEERVRALKIAIQVDSPAGGGLLD